MLRVLLYAGEGANPESLEGLKSLLTGYLRRTPPRTFAIDETSDGAEFRDPDRLAHYRLVAFPGGFDRGFVRCLGEPGMANLRQRVRLGACGYLGVCAGAYFACRRIEFARGHASLEVLGSRLGLYPGTGIGPVFPGFDYDSLAGARATEIEVMLPAGGDDARRVHVYFNGGLQFVDDFNAGHDEVEHLAVYSEPAAVDCGGLHRHQHLESERIDHDSLAYDCIDCTSIDHASLDQRPDHERFDQHQPDNECFDQRPDNERLDQHHPDNESFDQRPDHERLDHERVDQRLDHWPHNHERPDQRPINDAINQGHLDVSSRRRQTAVVLARCGSGAALLLGVHPEMAKANLEHSPEARLREVFVRLHGATDERRRATYRMLDQLMEAIGL